MTMTITRKIVAEKLEGYLNHRISRAELIDWCERAIQEEVFETPIVQQIIAQIGLMDARNFEVSYEELSEMLSNLGYHLKVEVL